MPEIRELLWFATFVAAFAAYIAELMRYHADLSKTGRRDQEYPQEDGQLRQIWIDATETQGKALGGLAEEGFAFQLSLQVMHEMKLRSKQSGDVERLQRLWPSEVFPLLKVDDSEAAFLKQSSRFEGCETNGHRLFFKFSNAVLELVPLLHTSPQVYTVDRWNEIVQTPRQNRGFKIIMALRLQSHVIAITSNDANAQISWHGLSTYESKYPKTPTQTLDTLLGPLENENQRMDGWLRTSLPSWVETIKKPWTFNTVFINPHTGSFHAFLDQAAIWWLYEASHMRGQGSYGRTPFWKWMRAPDQGGAFLSGIGRYTAADLLFFSGIPAHTLWQDVLKCPSRFARFLMAYWLYVRQCDPQALLAQSRRWYLRDHYEGTSAVESYSFLAYEKDFVTMTADEDEKIKYRKLVAIHGQKRRYTTVRHKQVIGDTYCSYTQGQQSPHFDAYEPIFHASATEWRHISSLILFGLAGEDDSPNPLTSAMKSFRKLRPGFLDVSTHIHPKMVKPLEDNDRLNGAWVEPRLWFIPDKYSTGGEKIWSVVPIFGGRVIDKAKSEKHCLTYIKHNSAQWTVGPFDFCGVTRVWNKNGARTGLRAYTRDQDEDSFFLNRSIMGRTLSVHRRKCPETVRAIWRDSRAQAQYKKRDQGNSRADRAMHVEAAKILHLAEPSQKPIPINNPKGSNGKQIYRRIQMKPVVIMREEANSVAVPSKLIWV